MAMSKEEKNARARARYAAKKAAGTLPKKRVAKRDLIAVSSPLRYPTVKHGARYGGEGNQVGMIGPPRKYKPRKPKSELPAPAPVKRARQRVKAATRPLSAVTRPLAGLGKPRKPRSRKTHSNASRPLTQKEKDLIKYGVRGERLPTEKRNVERAIREGVLQVGKPRAKKA